jgi:DNA-binding XRE family transcriptional regulator
MIENGKRNPSLNTIFAICSVLRIRPSAMLRPVEKDAGFEFISETQLARELLSRPRVSKFGKKKSLKKK